MRTIRLDLGFIGTRFEGWQSQGRGKTVQEVLEKALEKICGHRVKTVGSSRTDAGVHAAHYVAGFKTRSKIPDQTLVRALNFHLPPDIVVSRARTVKNSFHARFSAKSKTYLYRIWKAPTRPLFESPYVLWFPYGRLSTLSMHRAARCLIGRHDFKAFCDDAKDARSTIRRINRVRITQRGPEIAIEVTGGGFLKHMVRIIVGTLIEVGRGKTTVSSVSGALKARKRALAGPTAKAHGLTLLQVRYA